nr:GNAT family N-acetyltransferase [Methyloversatilis thermotolerans]
MLRPWLETLRREVFIVEQSVPEELEWDEDDARSVHALAWLADEAVACGRLLPDGQVGRLAVRAHRRGRGAGRAVLRALLDEAVRRGMRCIVLHAQTHALGFYEKEGFRAEGEVFDEAGIPHLTMRREL